MRHNGNVRYGSSVDQASHRVKEHLCQFDRQTRVGFFDFNNYATAAVFKV